MKTNWFKRTLCSILALVLVLGYFPVQTIAAESDGLCEHHTQHTTECGYSPAVEAHDCGHEHTDDCYNSVTACVHVHEDCGYVPAVEGHGCDCQPNDSGEIVHTEGCSYVEAVAEVPCDHVCSEETGCVTKVLNCQHQHDAACGYAEEAAETPCGFVCEECAKKEAVKNGLQEIPVESVTITQEEELSEVLVGETLELTAVILPENATDKTVTWSSSDESIATVDENGVVTGVSEGEVSIRSVVGEIQTFYSIAVIIPVVLSESSGNNISSCFSLEIQTATLPSINDSSVFIKQASADTCTLASSVMMLRRRAIIDNNTDWDKITESTVKSVAWGSSGLDYTFTYSGMTVKTLGLASNGYSTINQKKQFFIEWMNSNLEGIVIYNHSRPHAVLLTDYDANSDCFYCADPALGNGRIPLNSCTIPGNTQDEKIGNINQIWRITSSEPSAPTDPQDSNITPEEYLTTYAQKVTQINRTAVVNGTSANTWKLPWTNKSDENLKLGTVSGEITLIREIVNHVGNTWYEYDTGTSTRGFIYSGDVTVQISAPFYKDTEISASNITNDNAYLSAIIRNPSCIRLVRGGVRIGTSPGNFTQEKPFDIQASYQTKDEIPCTYDLKSECGFTLQPGTTYFFQFFVKSEDGTEYSSVVDTFKTTGTSSTSVSSISLSPSSKTLNVGDTVQLTATVSPTNATNKSLTWKSSNTSVATVSSTGLVTAKSVGTATITATAADGSGKSASATVTVQAIIKAPYYNNNEISVSSITTNNAYLTAIIQNPSCIKLVNGGVRIGTSAGSLTQSKSFDIPTSWQTKAQIDCTYDLKTECGFTLQPGTRYYYQFFVYEEGKPNSPYVSEVRFFDTASIAVSSISISPTTKTLDIGDTMQFTATVSPTNATNKSVTWKSSNTSVATVSSTGLVTAMGEGTAVITVTAADGSGKSASATVTVNPILVSAISLNPTNKTLNIGDTVQFTATVSPTNATNKSLTWKSSNTSVATVSSTGLVTANGEGTAVITVTATDGSRKSASATVTVNPILVSAISLSPTNKTLNIGDTVQLSATVSPSNATNKSLTWKSNNTSVATVSSTGLVTAKGAGTATITASAADGSGKSASMNITVLISSGFCGANGSNATYTLTDKGVLTITGSGKLKKYSQSATAPWYGNREKITSVVIEEGITSIGNYSFYFCSNLSSITIPEGVTSIGNYAFYECNSLQTATLPDSVSSVGEWSFAYCKSLASVKIPEGVTSIKTGTFQGCDILASVTLPQSLSSIGVQAFYNCCSLTSISIPQGVTSIGVGAFSNCESLTTFSIPEGVNAIESNTFYGCEKLTSVSIPKSVTSIGGYAFYSCLGLTSVTLPEGVTSIGEYAFRFCRSLTSISIPKNVTSIGESAFHECGALSSIHFLGNGFTGPNLFNKNVTAYYPRGNTTWTKAIRDSFGSYVTWIEVCTNHTEVVDPAKAPTCTENGLTEGKHCSACGIVLVKQEVVLATHQFEDGQCKICGLIVGSCGENLTYTLTSEGELTITGSGAMDDYVGSTSAPWYNRREEIVSVILSEGVTSIGTEAFLNCSNLISVSIPDGITSIGREAFSCCSKLSSVSIPSGVSSISDHCFYSCTKLTSISIPEGVTQIEDGAFENCSDLTSISLPNSVTSIGSSAFSDCCRLTKITIPSGVTTIGSGAFRACSQLTEITLPSGITTIGENTFSSCSRLNSIVIPNGVNSIGNDAFRWCVGLNSVAIPSSVTNIGSDAFDNCLSLTSITIPENVTSIGESAFYESAVAEIRFLGDGFRGTSNLFSSPVVAYYAANNATWTQEIRDSFGTKVTWRDSSENYLVLNNSELIKETQIWVDGVSYPVKKDSAGSYVNIPDNTSPVLVTYSYNNSSDDAHTQYPVGMQAYRIHQTETGATVERLPELDNLLQYSGSSIRITGNKGIRMITSVNQDTRNALTGNGLAGYKLLEYGTLLAQTSKLGNNPLVLGGGDYVKSNYAYKKDVADPVFKYADGLIQYTNVLIGFTDEQCKEDIAMRPYMKLLDENGEEFVIYGGIVYRSISYIAYQNRNAFQPGSAAYEYVWSIIRNVYGNQYDSEYKK